MISAPSEAAPQAPSEPLHVVAEDPAVRLIFTERIDGSGSGANLSRVVGDGDVTQARRNALAQLGGSLDRAVFMEQVHGGDVARVDAAHAGRGAHDHADAIGQVDALVTDETDLALVVMVADCVPVLLVNPGRGVAAVHAGRRGVEHNIVAAAVTELAGEDAGSVVALIGPAIGGCCYEVPAELAADVSSAWPQARAVTTWGTPALNLPAAVEAQLAACGVARVERLGSCTRCDADRFFSHRATTSAGAPAGRQAGIILRRGDGRSGVAPAPGRTGASLDSLDSS